LISRKLAAKVELLIDVYISFLARASIKIQDWNKIAYTDVRCS